MKIEGLERNPKPPLDYDAPKQTCRNNQTYYNNYDKALMSASTKYAPRPFKGQDFTSGQDQNV